MEKQEFIADLHIHGKYSRACSKNLSIENLEKYGKIKGLNLIGTGDFTHPEWIKELKSNLTEDETGFLKTKTGYNFILQTEISLIYTQGNKGRRVHQVVLAPDFDTVDQITETLLKYGRVDYDGRPIFKIPSPDFVELMKEINEDIEIIPAHIWTPWFGMLGSKSGFNSLKECFLEKSNKIHAIETGLSSDPEMNWRIKELDNKAIISASDSHSFWPHRIGREATVFDIKASYKDLTNSLKNNTIKSTIEFWPHEGKYHYDGHRACGIVMDPKEAIKHNNICPVCKKPLTIGVAHRVEELANRDEGKESPNAKPNTHVIPIAEVISGVMGQSVTSKKTFETYYNLINKFNNEINILFNASHEDLAKTVDQKIADAIIKNRNEKINFNPGYDGVYGEPIFDESTKNRQKELKNEIPKIIGAQKSLVDF
jgi:uncharacterized protein (TIGR00375 family)